MKVLITGATGLVGRELVNQCHKESISVRYFTTRKELIENQEDFKGYYWNPNSGEIDLEAFKGVSAIIHLAGATVAARWSKSYKKEILKSRTQSAALLYNSLKEIDHSITHFISASGISIYPSSETILYSEENEATDNSFLAEVVVAWEAEAHRFRELGMEVSVVRTGIVLAKNDGALPKLAKIIKMGLGAPLGSGSQWQSWIHIDDLVGIYLYILKNELEGIYNAVSSNPVTNKKLTKLLANHLGATLWLPNVPGFFLKLILGEMAVLALDGQLVSSKKIEANGYSFQYTNIEAAFIDLV